MATAPTLYWYQLDTGTLAATYFGQLNTTVAALCSENSVTAPTAPWQNQISCSLVSTWLKQIDTAVRSLCTILSVTAPATTLPNLNVGQYEATYWAQLDACVRLLCAAPAPYHADAVTFDGTQIMSRAPMTGVVDSPYGLLSVWVTLPEDAAKTWDPYSNQNFDINTSLTLDEDRKINLQGGFYELAQTNHVTVNDTLPNVQPAGYMHFLLSWDMNHTVPPGRVFQYYVTDVEQPINVDETGTDAFSVDYSGFKFYAMCGRNVNLLIGNAADYQFYPNIGSFVDLDIVANRRKFISASGKPVNPTTAIAAFGTPAILFTGNASAFATNQGTGGAFSLLMASEDVVGSNGPGPIDLTYAPVGRAVSSVLNTFDGNADITADFEATISIINKIQQTAATDYSETVIRVTLAAAITNAATSPSD